MSAYMQQLLTDEARMRLSNIEIVKPEKAAKLQQAIIANA